MIPLKKFNLKKKNYFDDLHLQFIESISCKAYIDISSAQWAIFEFSDVSQSIHKDSFWQSVM